jgi:hypothetical protein
MQQNLLDSKKLSLTAINSYYCRANQVFFKLGFANPSKINKTHTQVPHLVTVTEKSEL